MDLLDRLNDRLTAAVETAGDQAFPGGLTVADIYQRLVPYRTVRSQLGVVELAEYEHAMLRLLSGERHYVEVLDPDVRLEIQRELASLNPILGIYRDYSSAPLRLTGALPSAGAEPGAGPGQGEWSGRGTREPAQSPPGNGALADHDRVSSPSPVAAISGGPGTVEPGEPIGASERAEIAQSAAPDSTGSQGEMNRVTFLTGRRGPDDAPTEDAFTAVASEPEDGCARCGRPLPDLPDVRFCPFCGMEQSPAPCVTCGAPMDREWSFCTRCGTARRPAAAGLRNR